MTIKGSTGWYRRHDTQRLDPEADREKRRTTARANGMFDEFSERHAFETWFASSRKSRGPAFLEKCFERGPGGDYLAEPVQRHWWTWCNAVGAGRLLPPFSPAKIAADRLIAESTANREA